MVAILQEKLFKLEEYCNLARTLVGCIKRVLQRLEKQRFPKTVQGIKVKNEFILFHG